MSDLTRILAKLRPGADFADLDGTLGNVRWDTAGVDPPSQAEVNAESAKGAPVTVSRLRIKLELLERGLLPKVEQAVRSGLYREAEIYWADATDFESDHPLVLEIGKALGLSPRDIQALFAAAAARDA